MFHTFLYEPEFLPFRFKFFKNLTTMSSLTLGGVCLQEFHSETHTCWGDLATFLF